MYTLRVELDTVHLISLIPNPLGTYEAKYKSLTDLMDKNVYEQQLKFVETWIENEITTNC